MARASKRRKKNRRPWYRQGLYHKIKHGERITEFDKMIAKLAVDLLLKGGGKV